MTNDTKYIQRKKNFNQVYFPIIAYAVIMIGYNIFDTIQRFMSSSYIFYDFRLRWQESAYVLNGINPFDSINGGVILPEIGQIDSVAGTMPWAYLIGNIMIPGYLPFNIALVYFIVFYVLSGAICAILLWRHSEEKEVSRLSVLAILSFWCVGYALALGNYGTACCFLIIISILIYERRGVQGKILAGIIMAIAMCKPQVCGLFLLTFILIGEFIVPIVCLSIVLVSYIAVAVMTHTSALTLLSQIFKQGVNYNNVNINDGLFTFLRNFNISNTVILLLSLCFGIAIYSFAFRKLRRINSKTSRLICFLPAAICSSFWFYRNPYESMTLLIPVVAIEGLLYSRNISKSRMYILMLSWIGCVSGYLIFERFAYPLMYRIINNNYLSRDMALLMENSMYIVILIFLVNTLYNMKSAIGETHENV